MNYPQGPYPPPSNDPRHRQPPPYPQHRPPPSGPPPQRPPQYGPPPGQRGTPPQQYGGPPQQYGRPPEPPTQPYSPAPQQFGAPQPGQPPAYGQPQQGEAGEGIVVNTEFFPLAWFFFLIKPKILVDGQEQPAVSGWGRTVLPARPGQHQVHVHVPYFLPPKCGPADATVNVAPGRLTELNYKAPVFSFSPGSLGEGPQKYNGVGITIALVVAPFALMLLFIILGFVFAAI